jgi:trigger factor
MSAQQYGMDPNQFAQAIDSQGQIPAMIGEVARRKALAKVLEQATVTDTHGAAVDLEAVMAPGAALGDDHDHDHDHDHEGHDHEGHDHEGHDHQH